MANEFEAIKNFSVEREKTLGNVYSKKGKIRNAKDSAQTK